jgi:hypothetical protein
VAATVHTNLRWWPGRRIDHPAEHHRSFAAKGIFVAVRCGAFRVSPYIDNVDSDIQRLISAHKKQSIEF